MNTPNLAAGSTAATVPTETLKAQREAALRLTAGGPPARTTNAFFGVGPITNMTADERERRMLRFDFERWLEATYRKLDDRGGDRGPFTAGEIERSMHRGYPADKIVLDMMRAIHRYFEFPASNRMAVGLGGGHNGFSVALLHLMNPRDSSQHVYVDTPKPESPNAPTGGFFRQSWGAQVLELHRFAAGGAQERVHFAESEGHIPSASDLAGMGIKLFVGVGHETTGATTYNETDIRNLLEWLDGDPVSRHALIDGTSLLGAMPWADDLVRQLLGKACFFMPFQKAIGGIAGYFAATFTPQAIDLIEANLRNPAWAIPRHLKLAIPRDARRPLSGEQTTSLGPFYDPAQDKMLGGIINTFSNTAFAETTFGLAAMQARVGSVHELNRRSVANRQAVNEWVARHPLFELGVADETRRGAAVTLLRVKDPDVSDPATHARIIAKAKQLLGYEGLTHPNGEFERGLDVARYVNAFPGTPGDFRAWIGGARPTSDIVALLDNIEYCYLRAKIVVIEEALSERGIAFEAGSAGAAVTAGKVNAAAGAAGTAGKVNAVAGTAGTAGKVNAVAETSAAGKANDAGRPGAAGETRSPAERPEPLLALALDPQKVDEIRTLSERLTAFWGALSATEDPARRAELIERYGREVPGDAEALARLLQTRH